MDENNYAKHDGFEIVQNDLTELVVAFAAQLPQWLDTSMPDPTRSAAE
jgi:hypothetical protein